MLNEILTFDIYRFFLIFTRIGTAMMFMPGLGAQIVSGRIRLLLGLTMSLVLLPVIGSSLPPLPKTIGVLALLIGGEALIGIYLGMVTQFLMSALNIAGAFISFQVGMTNAFSFDAVAQQQSNVMTSLLTNLGMVMIFTTDLHHLMLQALADSYATFQPGQPIPVGDFTETLSHTLSRSFGFGIQMAAPMLGFGLVFYTGMGLMARLSPQMQIFFIAQPLQIGAGLWMLAMTLPLTMSNFLRWFENGLIPFLLPR